MRLLVSAIGLGLLLSACSGPSVPASEAKARQEVLHASKGTQVQDHRTYRERWDASGFDLPDPPCRLERINVPLSVDTGEWAISGQIGLMVCKGEWHTQSLLDQSNASMAASGFIARQKAGPLALLPLCESTMAQDLPERAALIAAINDTIGAKIVWGYKCDSIAMAERGI